MYRKLIKAIGLESRPECVLYGRAKGELQIGITNRRKADDMFSVVVSSKLEQNDMRQSVHRQLSQVSKHQIMVVLEENFERDWVIVAIS